ncbi:MAG: hypothetical protein HC889_16175, partial [Synechococcaceae cyanobacterium SM1_2_3]|nr:hypothetical protein [Synechococcaceae cyanobacterium SM1_2_3]
IGLPDPGLFYCSRRRGVLFFRCATWLGLEVIIAGKSHITHPKSDRYVARFLGCTLICLRLPPWKRYYDTRNRLLIAKKYYGFRWVTQTIPGSFVRLFAALGHEPRKRAQLWAFCAGFIDGLLGLKGQRHRFWRIPF